MSALPSVLPERLIQIELSPWGSEGPYAGWRGSEIATWAMGGYMFFTGDPDGAPLMIPGRAVRVTRRRPRGDWRVDRREGAAALGARAERLRCPRWSRTCRRMRG